MGSALFASACGAVSARGDSALTPLTCPCDSSGHVIHEAYEGWRREWNNDWDGRAPDVRDGLKPPKPQGRHRHILLIRHGQYDLDSEDHGLTALGVEQSRLLGQRLLAYTKQPKRDRYGEVKMRYAGIWSSDVQRARQTAVILSEELPDVPLMPADPLLAEGKPIEPNLNPQSRSKKELQHAASYWEDSARIEAAFRRYFHRDVDGKRVSKEEVSESYAPQTPLCASAGQEDSATEHTFEIVVCHMNVIRYFVMRALQLPPERWLNLGGYNTGITEIVIKPHGSVSLVRFGDVGHLGIDKTTFH